MLRAHLQACEECFAGRSAHTVRIFRATRRHWRCKHSRARNSEHMAIIRELHIRKPILYLSDNSTNCAWRRDSAEYIRVVCVCVVCVCVEITVSRADSVGIWTCVSDQETYLVECIRVCMCATVNLGCFSPHLSLYISLNHGSGRRSRSTRSTSSRSPRSSAYNFLRYFLPQPMCAANAILQWGRHQHYSAVLRRPAWFSCRWHVHA